MRSKLRELRRRHDAGLRWVVAAVLLVCGPLTAPALAVELVVNNAGDPGSGPCDEPECTLREAIAAAEANSEADLITIAPGIDPVLSLASEIEITTEILIVGQGAGATTIFGGLNSRIFDIADTGDLTIEDLTLADGRAPNGPANTPGEDGGAILNAGHLRLVRCVVSGNRAGNGSGVNGHGGRGGAIFNTGTVIISHCSLSGNEGGNGGGGLTQPGGQGGHGGAIYNDAGATLEITDSAFAANRGGPGGTGTPAGSGGGGGAILNAGVLRIRTSTLSGNRGGENSVVSANGGPGGAIRNTGTGHLTIEVSTLSGNRGGVGGGLIRTGGSGGAISNSGILTLTGATLSGNAGGAGSGGGGGGNGGAISNSGTLKLRASTLSGNVTGNLLDSPAPGRGVGAGGALDNTGTFLIESSTISGNHAPQAAFGSRHGFAGAIRHTGNGTGMLIASTIAGNTAGRLTGGINMPDVDGNLTFINTLVAENTVNSEEINCTFQDPSDSIDGGGNLDDGNTCGFGPESLSDTPAGLDPAGLGDNGGPTRTMALTPGSSAIDRGDDAQCPEIDQRGVLRGLDGVGDGGDDDLDGGCDIGAFETGGLGPVTVAVDAPGNGVLEPGEAVEVAPAWRDIGAPLESPITGTGTGLTGPGGAIYALLDAEAAYLIPPPGETTGCQESGNCFAIEVSTDGQRPTLHWDASLVEVLDAGPSTHTWNLHVGASFTDVPRTHLFYRSIETALHGGITDGCNATEYCPAGQNTRAQLPVFVLRAAEGPDYVPQPCDEDTQAFADVPFDGPFCPWIEELARREVVAGCGGDNYCPGSPVTRAQMSIFLLKTLLGSDYTPTECDSVFADVACPSLFADWIEDLFTRGITGGCSATEYCPAAPVNRGQMAVFVSKAFELTLYGP